MKGAARHPIFLAAAVRFPLVSFKARMINCFSASLTVKSFRANTRAGSPDGAASDRTVRGKSRAEIRSPRHSTTALSMAVRNSRTLPGQRWFINSSSASAVKSFTGLLFSLANSRRKFWASKFPTALGELPKSEAG
jgi:hypothetical protein